MDKLNVINDVPKVEEFGDVLEKYSKLIKDNLITLKFIKILYKMVYFIIGVPIFQDYEFTFSEVKRILFGNVKRIEGTLGRLHTISDQQVIKSVF